MDNIEHICTVLLMNDISIILRIFGIDIHKKTFSLNVSLFDHSFIAVLQYPTGYILNSYFFFVVGPPESDASIRVGKGNSRSWDAHAGTQCQGSSVSPCSSNEPLTRQIWS